MEVREERKTIVEEPPVQSKGSNGVAEGAVHEIEGGFAECFWRSWSEGKLSAKT